MCHVQTASSDGLGQPSDKKKPCLLSITQQPTLINCAALLTLANRKNRPAAVFPPVDPPEPRSCELYFSR